MMMLLLMFVSFLAEANPTRNWSSAVEIVDKHEFYKNNEMIQKPQNSWQLLFGVVYVNARMSLKKDCVFYKTPGDSLGILKIKTLEMKESCESFSLLPGDWEKPDIKALQYTLLDNSLTLHLTLSEYKVDVWNVEFVNKSHKVEAKPSLSSAEFKTKKVLYLAPDSLGNLIPPKTKKSKKPVLCHNISESCEELSASTCSQCPEGWHEIPNGCPQGPKYCGVVECGKENAPACRRGMKYQRVRKTYDCSTDSSFAFCAPGLEVFCDGKLAYCR
mgnify:CR=1 FL=1